MTETTTLSRQKQGKSLVMLFFCMIVTLPTIAMGFLSPAASTSSGSTARHQVAKPLTTTSSSTTTHSSSSALAAAAGGGGGFGASPSTSNNNNNSNNPNQADFQYRELKIQLNAMLDQNVVTSQLMPEKRVELEGYVKRVLNRRPSPVPMYDVYKYISGTKWKLAFSTQSLVSDLPKDARISLYFLNDDMLNYNLEFTKTLGLNKLTARSSYSVDSSPVNPGVVSYTYEKVTTDVFGLSNVGVGLFGMLNGRTSYIFTKYFDGEVWIESAVDSATGVEYYNVYLAQDD